MEQKEIEKIAEEIINPNLDLSIDYGEIALDEFLGEGILKEVPVVKTLISLIKTGIAIRERFFIKKFLVFLTELHSKSLPKQTLEDFKTKFESNQNYREKITEQVLIHIESLNSIKKARILACLFNSHIDGHYDWNRFVDLALALDKLSESCYVWLGKIADGRHPDPNVKTTFLVRPQIFENDFVIMREIQSLLIASGICYVHGTAVTITKLGQDLYLYGIKKVS